MKLKLIALIGLLGLSISSNAQQTFPWSTNVTGTGIFLVTTNRANIKQIQISAGTGSPYIELFNCDSLVAPKWGTNYVFSSYVSKASYATNIASSYVDTLGNTNWYTNSGIFSYSVTNAASTNALNPAWVGVAQPNTAMLFNTDILNERGTAIRYNTNCSIVIWYNNGQ